MFEPKIWTLFLILSIPSLPTPELTCPAIFPSKQIQTGTGFYNLLLSFLKCSDGSKIQIPLNDPLSPIRSGPWMGQPLFFSSNIQAVSSVGLSAFSSLLGLQSLSFYGWILPVLSVPRLISDHSVKYSLTMPSN